MTDHDDLRAAVARDIARLADSFRPVFEAAAEALGDLGRQINEAGAAPDDTPAMHIDPEPPVWCSEHMEPYCPRHAALDSVPRHTRASTDTGPDYCRECSEAAQEWVKWPCSDTLSEPPSVCPHCGQVLPHSGTSWKEAGACRSVEPLSDEAAMHIDPEPPGVTTRPFTDAEIAALDAEPPRWVTEPPSGGDRLRERLRTDAEAAAKRPAHEKRHMPAIAESIAPTLQNPSSGGEVTADELLALLPKRTHPECAAAILARYDVRRKP